MPVSKRELVAKWSKEEHGPISIAGIKDETLKEQLAQCLENQETGEGLIKESFTDSTLSLSQIGTTDGAVPGAQDAWKFKPITLALVRRTFPELFANKVVGVQAMNGPVGLAFAFRVLYASGNTDNLEAAWQNVDYWAGYTGSQAQTSGVLDQYGTAGIFDTSATGASTSAAEGWQITASGTWPQLKTKVDQKTITAVTRKLATSFSLESAQDLKAMHGIELERLMVEYLQYEIVAELDRELLYRMKVAATTTANGGEVIPVVNVSGTAVDGRWSQEKFSNIANAIIYQANRIATLTRRGAGNFAVVSPAIATALQSLNSAIFTRNTADVNATKAGVAEVGKLNNDIVIYRDSYARNDYALVGYKGPGINDCGIIYSPYVTGLTERAIDPYDFSPRIGVLHRYAITDTLLNSGRYYRLLVFSNMNQVIPGAVNTLF